MSSAQRRQPRAVEFRPNVVFATLFTQVLALVAMQSQPVRAADSELPPSLAQMPASGTAPGPVILFPEFRNNFSESTPFFRDMKADATVRSFYFNRDPVNDKNSEAWALGGSLGLQSGWIADLVSFGLRGYTSQPLYAPDGRDGTLLLQPGQEGYTVLGEAYGKIKLFDNEVITLGRSLYNTPYIGPNDNRMTPNTFQNYTLAGALNFAPGSSLKFDVGYVDQIKERNASNFKYMSKSAGANVEEGVGLIGGTLAIDNFSLTAYEYYSQDVINIIYGEAKYAMPLGSNSRLGLAAQYTDQRSVGDDRLTGSSFDTGQAGFKAEWGIGGAVFTAAYTVARDGATLRNPWSGYPGYTSVQVQDFNRAGEQAVLGKVAYDMSRIGLTGLSAYALVVHGWTDARAAGPAKIKETEADFDLEWRLPWEELRGLSVRLRYAFIDLDQTTTRGTIHDFRAILNYNLLVF